MKEQIKYMFLHDGERNAEITKRLSTLIDEYCEIDEDMEKISEVEDTWKGLVLLHYNIAMNEILDKAVNG